MGDSLDLVGGSGDKGEGVSGFVTNGSHADSAEAKDFLSEIFLLEANVFNSREFNNASRVVKKTPGGDLNSAEVSNK